MLKHDQNLHLKCVVLLLADALERLRNNKLKNYELYPSHCLIEQALSWDGILHMVKLELETIPGHNMYIFFKKNYELCQVIV